jgi:NAD(P) transhydrogenase subunit alpha
LALSSARRTDLHPSPEWKSLIQNPALDAREGKCLHFRALVAVQGARMRRASGGYRTMKCQPGWRKIPRIHVLGPLVLPGAALLPSSPAQAAEPAAATSFDFTTMIFVFMLATFIGLGVITRVSRLLHTPLMSITNAISAIAVVGSVIITGLEHPPIITLLGAVALFSSMTNIVSGFLITDRMLKMFKAQKQDKP